MDAATAQRGGPILRLLTVVLGVAACAVPPRGIHHVVQRGENLFRIGKAYDIHYRELARFNGLPDASRIAVGQKIFIPGATRQLPVEIITPRSVDAAVIEDPPPRGAIPAAADGTGPFGWPTREGVLSSRFGRRNGTIHDGIDIAAPEGTPVLAARDGRVIYSDRIPGYGNIVILDHGGGVTTVYAHNSRNEVREGETVKRGQRIARIGQTGRTTGPNLHFELRRENVARDPLAVLPPLSAP